MPEIAFSVCIPTYNRSKFIYKTLTHLLQSKCMEFEVVVGNNGSIDDTDYALRNINDARIIYFKNRKNLGFDANLLKCVEKAKGGYVLFSSDEDFVEIETIPWIITTIRNNKNITQILGEILRYKQGKMFRYENKLWTVGSNSLLNFFYQHAYFSGIILKRSSLDLNKAKKYIGCAYTHQVLMAQAMLSGNTLTTSKILCRMGEEDEVKVDITKKNSFVIGESPYLPISRFFQMLYRKKLVIEITERLPETRIVLLNKERRLAAAFLAYLFCIYPYSFFNLLPFFLKIKEYSRSLEFWKQVLRQFYYYILNLLKYNYKLKIFLGAIISPNQHNIKMKWPRIF